MIPIKIEILQGSCKDIEKTKNIDILPASKNGINYEKIAC